MKLVYTKDAIDDLARLREFIEIHDPPAARRISSRLVEGLSNLKQHPLLGRPVRRAADPEAIRDLVLGDYVARDLVHSEQIVVLRIWHHRENRDA